MAMKLLFSDQETTFVGWEYLRIGRGKGVQGNSVSKKRKVKRMWYETCQKKGIF
jgi:hypothetical protein